MRYFLFYFCFLFSAQIAYTQSIYPQDATIQLDENGQAIIVSTDVLVNLNGKIHSYNQGFGYTIYDYNHQELSLTEVNAVDTNFGELLCEAINPINKKSFASGFVIDWTDFFTSSDLMGFHDLENGNELIPEYSTICFNGINIPNVFVFDNDGNLITFGDGGLVEYGLYSNIHTPLNIPFGFSNLHHSNMTYDFDNHRLIATKKQGPFVEVYAIDLATTVVELLFTIPEETMCPNSTIEYIGANTLIANSAAYPCQQSYGINLLTAIVTPLNPDEYQVMASSTFIENEIENVTLSTTKFSCDDLGENIIDITYVENGETFSYQSIVTIVSDFAIINCPRFVNFNETPNDETTDALMPDFASDVEVRSSCSSNFTITQDPAPGTLIPYGEATQVLITVTDEFDNETHCSIETCSRSILSNGEFSLEDAISIYPNPTDNIVNIENKDGLLLTAIQIQDVNGRILKEITPNTGQVTALPLSDLASGVYFIKVEAGTNNLVKQIIKL